jgi:CheY-like chemotaxis protein
MKMLVVDDEPTVRKFLSDVAQTQNITLVDMAASAEEAMTFVIRNHYDLITLDLHMPGASGLEILALVRNMCPHAIIAIISGKVTEESLPDMGVCVDLVLRKPVSVERLIELLQLVKDRADNFGSIGALSDEEIPPPPSKNMS